jgi:hypothetical protein
MYGETAYASDMQLVEFVLCGLLSGIGDIDIPPVDAINSLLAFAIQCDGFFDEALRELIVVVMCRSLAQVVDADCEISPLGGKIFAWLSLLKLRFVCFFFFLFGGSCFGAFRDPTPTSCIGARAGKGFDSGAPSASLIPDASLSYRQRLQLIICKIGQPRSTQTSLSNYHYITVCYSIDRITCRCACLHPICAVHG